MRKFQAVLEIRKVRFQGRGLYTSTRHSTEEELIEPARIYIWNRSSKCSNGSLCSSDCIKYIFFQFLQCARIFIKSGGTRVRLVVEVPLRLPPLWLVPGKNYINWYFGLSAILAIIFCSYTIVLVQVQFATNKTERRKWISFLIKLHYYRVQPTTEIKIPPKILFWKCSEG